jgi:HEAT repeats
VIEKGVSAMSTRRAARAVFVVVLLVIGSAVGTAASVAFAAQPKGPVLDVTVTSSRISLTARETPLADVLAAIGRQAGVKMVLRGDLNTSVTETLVNLPVGDAIQRLSRWHSVVLIYDRSIDSVDGPVLTEVWVTSSSSRPWSTNPDSTKPEARGIQSNQATDGRQQASQARNPELTIALKHGASESRKQIIEALVRERGGYAVVEILREAATRDPDPRVRRGAIQVLASLDSPDAVDAVRATLRDAHPGVRYEADMALRRQRRARSSDGSVD